MPNIQWMHPLLIAVGVPVVCLIAALLAWHNMRTLAAVQKLWGYAQAEIGSTVDHKRLKILWFQWTAYSAILIVAMGGPNSTMAPQMVATGSTMVAFMPDVSPSMGAEDTRQFYEQISGEKDPGLAFPYGTRLDTAKIYLKNDLLPQLGDNEAGIITVEGAGYNMWDITRDLSPTGSFNHMLRFVQVGAAPGAGCDYTSGITAALDEFDLIGKLEQKGSDPANKVRFIVLFTDGGFTGNRDKLDKVLLELNKRQIRLLVVVVGGSTAVSVKKIDPATQRYTDNSYPGMTRVDFDDGRTKPVGALPVRSLLGFVPVRSSLGIRPGYPIAGDLTPKDNILVHMHDVVKDSVLIWAPPGTSHIHYDFPQAAGGLYARAAQSNLRPWLLMVDLLIFLLIASGGGGLPRRELFTFSFETAELRNLTVTLTSWLKRHRP